MKLTLRVIEPCEAIKEARDCEREDGHPGDHWYSVWEQDPGTGDWWPAYPVTWPQGGSA